MGNMTKAGNDININKKTTGHITKDIVNVFDFDGTIYDGESLIDYFFFYL